MMKASTDGYPYKECTMITTLRAGTFSGRDSWLIDITVNADGSVSQTIGPFFDRDLAARWERWLLLHEHTVTMILTSPPTAMIWDAWYMHIEWADAETECLPAYHQHWMDAHPLQAAP